MSMGCARGCGDCCDPVFLTADQVARADYWADAVVDVFAGHTPRPGSDAAFIAEHWHEIERLPSGSARYRCDFFDAELRECTAHDKRPQVCSGFPWYGEQPHQGRVSGRCSYQWDLPGRHVVPMLNQRPLLPIEPVSRG